MAVERTFSILKPDATALELKAALMQSVDQGPAFRSQVASNGRLNVFRALQAITNASLPPVVVGASPASSLTHQDAPIEIPLGAKRRTGRGASVTTSPASAASTTIDRFAAQADENAGDFSGVFI
jgi:hypothetical protein